MTCRRFFFFLFIITVDIHSRIISNLAIFFQGRVARQVQGTMHTGAILFIASPLICLYILSYIYYTTTTTTRYTFNNNNNNNFQGETFISFYYPSKWPPGISPLATRKTCYYTIISDNFRLLYVAYLYVKCVVYFIRLHLKRKRRGG